MRRILVALDARESPLVEAAVATANGAPYALTVISPAPEPSPWIWFPFGYVGAVNRDQLHRDALAAAERALARARDLVPPDVLLTTRVVTCGGCTRALLREARSGRHDAVVVRGPGASRLERLVVRWRRARLARCGVVLIDA